MVEERCIERIRELARAYEDIIEATTAFARGDRLTALAELDAAHARVEASKAYRKIPEDKADALLESIESLKTIAESELPYERLSEAAGTVKRELFNAVVEELSRCLRG